ncbi:hypothetical protein B0H13DRAFT_2530027 [Mycena leptocephala]|nr:hypothetical protein B0H13DRAFT_2530027 [Mycena leptocephala]
MESTLVTTVTTTGGRMPPKSGWRTYAIIYHLRGGTRAQAFFSKCQIAAAQRVHSIRFSPVPTPAPPYTIPDVVGLDLPNIVEMAAEDRFWLRNPCRPDILDFIFSHRKSKRVRFADSDGDESDGSAPSRPVKKQLSNVVLSDEESDSNPKSGEKSTSPSTENKDEENQDADDIDFEINCRCGEKGNRDPAMVPERLVKCTICSVFSHVACQQNGRASLLNGRKKLPLRFLPSPEPKKRKRAQPDTPPRMTLPKRLLVVSQRYPVQAKGLWHDMANIGILYDLSLDIRMAGK